VKANPESRAAAINILIWTSLRMQPAFCWLTGYVFSSRNVSAG
jgi:hypothetical protein